MYGGETSTSLPTAPCETRQTLHSCALQASLSKAGVKVYGGEKAVGQMGLEPAPATKHEYGSKALTLVRKLSLLIFAFSVAAERSTRH